MRKEEKTEIGVMRRGDGDRGIVGKEEVIEEIVTHHCCCQLPIPRVDMRV